MKCCRIAGDGLFVGHSWRWPLGHGSSASLCLGRRRLHSTLMRDHVGNRLRSEKGAVLTLPTLVSLPLLAWGAGHGDSGVAGCLLCLRVAMTNSEPCATFAPYPFTGWKQHWCPSCCRGASLSLSLSSFFRKGGRSGSLPHPVHLRPPILYGQPCEKKPTRQTGCSQVQTWKTNGTLHRPNPKYETKQQHKGRHPASASGLTVSSEIGKELYQLYYRSKNYTSRNSDLPDEDQRITKSCAADYRAGGRISMKLEAPAARLAWKTKG